MKTALLAALCAAMGLAPALVSEDRVAVQPVTPLVHGGPFGGRILSLAADPTDVNVLYAGTDVGLFRSADGGTSWTLLSVGREYLSPASGLVGDSVEAVTVSPADPSIVFASVQTDNRVYFPGQGTVRNLFRTDDSGQTWNFMLTDGGPFSLSTSAGIVYVNANFDDGKAVRSTDNGLTFVHLPIVNVQSIAADPLVPTTVYAAVSSPTYSLVDVEKSADAGNRWQATPLAGADVSRLHVDPSRHLTVYAEGNAFRRSDDGGAHWTGNLWSLVDPIAAFAVGADDRLYAATSVGEVYESENRGDTWSLAGAVPAGLLSLAAAGGVLLGGTDGKGVFRSDDRGASWTTRNVGLDGAPVSALAAAPNAPGIAYALAAGFARTTDFGRTWSVDPSAPTAFTPAFPSVFSGRAFAGAIAVDPGDSRTVYASDATAGVRRSGDGGVTWTSSSATPRFVTSIAISATTPASILIADGQLWKSADRGESWRLVSVGIPDGAYLIVADPATTGLLYAATPDLYRSEDDGQTWSLAISAADLGVIRIFQVSPDPAHPGTVYAMTEGVSKSVDRGTTWTSLALPFPYGPTAMAVDVRGVVSLGTMSLGLPRFLPIPADPLRSTDGGATWHRIGSLDVASGPVGYVSSMSADSEGRLYAGMASNGVWQSMPRLPQTVPPR